MRFNAAWLFTQIHQNTASNYIISIILRCLMNNCIRCWYVCSIWGRLKVVDRGMGYHLLLQGCGTSEETTVDSGVSPRNCIRTTNVSMPYKWPPR
jgi:hypothetical protein